MTDKLVAWLGRQIDEDERDAKSWRVLRYDAEPTCARCHKPSSGAQYELGRNDVRLDCGHTMPVSEYEGRYLAPAPPKPRDTAEIKFKRSLLDALAEADPHAGYITATYTARDALRDMAAVYAGRDGYEEAIRA